MSPHAVLRNDTRKSRQQTYAVLARVPAGQGMPVDLSLSLYAGVWIIGEGERVGVAGAACAAGTAAVPSARRSTLVIDGLPVSGDADTISIDDPRKTDECVQASGFSRRHAGVEHRRTVTVSRSLPVVTVEDEVKSDGLKADSKIGEHQMSLAWRLAPGLTAVVVGGEVHLLQGRNKVAKICIQADTTVVTSVDGTTLRVALGSVPSWHCTTTFVFPRRSATGVSLPFETLPGEWPIQYRLETHAQSDVLCVVLPAMAGAYDYKINYLKLLRDAPVNRLFVLDDFGPQGSYLIALDGDVRLGDALCAMLESMRARLGIDKRNVVFMGSSKGGTTALYVAHRLGYGRVLAGAPQTRIGHFLLRQDVANGWRLANHMCPGKSAADALDWLDRLIFDLPVGKDVDCRIHVGEGDHHYRRHVLPYLGHVRKLGGQVELHVGDYERHSELGEHFPHYVVNTLGDLFGITFSDPSSTAEPIVNSTTLSSPDVISPVPTEPKMTSAAPVAAHPALTVMAWREGDELVGRIAVPWKWSAAQVEFAFYLQIANEKKEVRWYEDSPTTRFAWPAGADPDILSIKGFVREVGNPDYKLSATAPLLRSSAAFAQ